jgi:glycosyltransferase involved in cell wall biosynthesis
MEKHIARLTVEQRQLGLDVRIVFNHGIRTSEDDIQVLPKMSLRKVRSQALRDFLFLIPALAAMLIARVRADVVHIHGDWSAFLFGKCFQWVLGARISVASIHGGLRGGAWWRVYRWLLKGYDVVYCTGAREMACLQSWGVSQALCQNSGIDSQFLRVESSASITKKNDVICIANFYPVKNLALVIAIARAMPDRTFVLVGEGPLRQAIQLECVAGAISNIRFTGSLTPWDVAAELRSSKIFLSTSFSEGTPTALLEAMACGLPIVTSCSNNYTGLIESGVNGYVVDGFEHEKYVSVLEILLRNEELQGKIAVCNEEGAQQHAWPRVAARITDWIKTVSVECERPSTN